MSASNDDVLQWCEGFLKSMSTLTSPADMGVDLYTSSPLTDHLAEMARGVAHGDPSHTPVSLTLARGHDASFVMRGTHVYATLKEHRQQSLWILVSLIVAVLLMALMVGHRGSVF